MTRPRYQCPECGRAICSTDGQVYEVRDPAKRTRRYVYLRRHNRAPGVRCTAKTARVVAP